MATVDTDTNIVQIFELAQLPGKTTVNDLIIVERDEVSYKASRSQINILDANVLLNTQFNILSADTLSSERFILNNYLNGELNKLAAASALAGSSLQASNNLSDLSNVAAARTNLGIDTTSNIVSAVLQALYPVGEMIITRRSGSPSTWLGFGTWERYAIGRTLVGLDEGQTEFNELDKSGGNNEVTLVLTQIPPHVHSQGCSFTGAGKIEGYSTTAPKNDNYSVTPTGSSGGTGPSGTALPHNNLQPYVTVFMWRRTA